ncbi:MAG: hypothetical protein NT029_00775 [Armatimonadetes bacterium]|nr:hypothetical protein [Armatimonadota bacterium]
MSQSGSALLGAIVRRLTPSEAESVAGWVIGEGPQPSSETFSPRWALIQCSDALVWGILGDAGWVLGSSVPGGGRRPSLDALIEMRVFGPDAEVLIWQADEGIVGRLLSDRPGCADGAGPVTWSATFQPPDHHPVVTLRPGKARTDTNQTVAEAADGFVVRSSREGRTTVTPPGSCVIVVQYMQRDDETGVVRLAGARLAEVK